MANRILCCYYLNFLAVKAVIWIRAIHGLKIGEHQPERPSILSNPFRRNLWLIGSCLMVPTRHPFSLFVHLYPRSPRFISYPESQIAGLVQRRTNWTITHAPIGHHKYLKWCIVNHTWMPTCPRPITLVKRVYYPSLLDVATPNSGPTAAA